MIGWLIRATATTLLLGLLGYVAITVPIGRRTLFEHAVAIARTQPAQELAEDVGGAARMAAQRVRTRLEK